MTKYPYWEEQTNEIKWKISKHESELETNNGTTKDDLTKIVKFLVSEAYEDMEKKVLK